MKIIITEKQYKMILLKETENKSILNEAKDDILIDNSIILAINYLLGKKVTNHNEELLKKALNDENTFKEIKNILESKEKLKQLGKTMETKGFQNPLETLKNNFKNIMEKFNKESKEYTLGFLAEI